VTLFLPLTSYSKNVFDGQKPSQESHRLWLFFYLGVQRYGNLFIPQVFSQKFLPFSKSAAFDRRLFLFRGAKVGRLF
jgi:hypothetical protein